MKVVFTRRHHPQLKDLKPGDLFERADTKTRPRATYMLLNAPQARGRSRPDFVSLTFHKRDTDCALDLLWHDRVRKLEGTLTVTGSAQLPTNPTEENT